MHTGLVAGNTEQIAKIKNYIYLGRAARAARVAGLLAVGSRGATARRPEYGQGVGGPGRARALPRQPQHPWAESPLTHPHIKYDCF